MSTHELDELEELRSAQPYAHLREREAQAEFLIGAARLLMRTTKLVAAGLDAEATLASVARLVLPHPGVWSMLDVREDRATRRVAVSHHSPSHQVAARELVDAWPPLRDSPSRLPRVMRTGRSEIIPAYTDAMLSEVADSPKQLELLRKLDIGSVLTVALKTGTETIGTLTFIAPRSGAAFDNRDRLLAEDVAAGAALAIANSRVVATEARSRAAIQRIAAERLAFISSLSHGLRTPLHAIYGFAQLLAEGVRGPLTVRQHQDVHRIQENERQVLRLVDSVIAFARWDDGETLTLEDVSVRTAVNLTNAIVVRAARKNGMSYDPELNTLDAQLTVRAEPRRLREILLQLLLNAVRFSRPGDSVLVSALPVDDKVWIRVTDTGVGIAKQHLDSVFLPLSHASGGSENGVGLGLAVTQSLARTMGGELSVTSEQGRGSTFTLALPRGQVP